MCQHPSCPARLHTSVGHKHCRRHAPCRNDTDQGAIWDPAKCHVCQKLWNATSSTTKSVDEVDRALDKLRVWVAGFRKNVKGSPYLPSEAFRRALFPSASPASVLGYRPELPVVTIPPAPQLEDLSIHHEETETEELEKDEDNGHDDDSSSISSRTESRVLRPSRSPSRSPSPNRSLTQPSPSAQAQSATSPGPHSPVPVQIPQVEGFSPQMAAAFAQLAASIKSIQSDMSALKASANPSTSKTTEVIPLDPRQLPDCTPQNPWKFCSIVPISEGFLLFADGNRPIQDLEFWPSFSAYPACYARLNAEAEKRDDIVPKESIILEYGTAQKMAVREFKAAKCTNTGITAFEKKKASFTTPDTFPLKFTQKAWEAVEKALVDGKPLPTLEECRPLSLALPCPKASWTDIHQTFSVGKLPNNIAQKQFNEQLPLLSEAMLKRELDARERLASVLSHQVTLEILNENYSESDLFALLAKQHLPTLLRALYDFGLSRRECRRHVMQFSKVRHEPQRLIDSSIWGKDLFPDDLVKEIMDQAAKENRNLTDKWGITFR